MNDPQNPASRADSLLAEATLYQLLSAAFAYPETEFVTAIVEGKLTDAVERCARQPGKPRLQDAAGDFRRALAACAATINTEQLQSDYIALFELNRDQPPLHLHAHLYTPGRPDPVPVYQRLISIYREFGLEPRADAAVEQPDHLTVQLEFMAWLYQLREQSARAATQADAAGIEAAIEAFRSELAWVRVWLEMLDQRGGHPLYSALGRLLAVLLETG